MTIATFKETFAEKAAATIAEGNAAADQYLAQLENVYVWSRSVESAKQAVTEAERLLKDRENEVLQELLAEWALSAAKTNETTRNCQLLAALKADDLYRAFQGDVTEAKQTLADANTGLADASNRLSYHRHLIELRIAQTRLIAAEGA